MLSHTSLCALILDPTIKPKHKMLLTAFSCLEQFTSEELSRYTHIPTTTINNLTKEMMSEKLMMIANREIVFNYNGEEVRCRWTNCQVGLIRRPRSTDTITKAREKLEQMRLIGFVGDDIYVVRVSKEYDRLLLKYTGKSSVSIPPNFFRAIKSQHWIHFKRLHHLLIDRQFPTIPYLEAQFQAMRSNGKAGKVYPYPAMLYSTWAINNYLSAVQDNLAKQVDEEMFNKEEEIIKGVFESSIGIVTEIMRANHGMTELQAILISQDSLAPVYLATHPVYLSYANQHEQELPDGVLRVLQRFDKDSKFRTLITTIKKELTCR